MTHSIVLLMVWLYRILASEIPTALLAGILIKVGLDIIDWGFLEGTPALGENSSADVWSAVDDCVLGLNLGVLVGMFVANLLTVDSMTQVQLDKIEADNPMDQEAKNNQNMLSKKEQSILIPAAAMSCSFAYVGP